MQQVQSKFVYENYTVEVRLRGNIEWDSNPFRLFIEEYWKDCKSLPDARMRARKLIDNWPKKEEAK